MERNKRILKIIEFRKRFFDFLKENKYDIQDKDIQDYLRGLVQHNFPTTRLTHDLAIRIGFSDKDSVNGKFRHSRIYDKDGRFMEISETEDGHIYWTCGKDLHWIAPMPYVQTLAMAMTLCGLKIDLRPYYDNTNDMEDL